MKKSRNQAGGAHLLLLCAILLTALIAFVGIRIYSNQADKAISNIASEDGQTIAPEGHKLHYDSVGSFNITLKKGWKVRTEKGEQAGDPTTATTIILPSGQLLSVSVDYGGKGGDCQPRESDLPHHADNACPTLEYLSKEAITQTVHKGYDNKSQSLPIYLVTAKYSSGKRATQASETHYFIGLETEEYELITLNKPVMGLYSGASFFGVFNADDGMLKHYVYANAKNSSEAFLQSQDAEDIKEAFRSFKFN